MKASWATGAIAVSIMAVLAGAAHADDLNPAPWRTDPAGQPPTTLQIWEFSDDSNPAYPDLDLNPYGTASAWIEYGGPYVTWIDEDYGHQGVWYVEDWIELTIQNNPDPNEQKLVWLQLTYYADGSGDPQIFTDPAWVGEIQTMAKVPLDDYYWHATYLITIEPNPEQETIWILPRDCTIYVDQIVVDTICTPEPGALLLLLFGGVSLLRRR